MKKLPLGVSDFKDLISGEYYYVDKTLFIKEVIDKGDKILLIPRPRRFGKTLNISMLKYFYDCCPAEETMGTDAVNSYKKLFHSLAISKSGNEYLDKMGKHPVIFFTFKNIKELEWETCLVKIKQLIQEEYSRHDYLLESPKMKPHERDYFQKVMNLKGHIGDYENSLEKLLIFLNRYYGERGVILIDEYDAPVHAGFKEGYYDEIINFMRNFLCGGLKDTDRYLEKSVITGIMRIAKESIFSGLNNPGVYTLLSEEFDDKFGFTQKEVEALLEDFQLLDKYDEVQHWYNGYRFGENIIYNPWSIINFLGSKAKKCKPYWVNTSDNQMVDFLLSKGGKELKKELEQLIRGENIEKAIDENIVLKYVSTREDLLWSFLLMGGYLKQTPVRRDEISGKMYYTLLIPNLEVKTLYVQIIEQYFAAKIQAGQLEIMLKSLLEGNIDVFAEIFSDYVVKSMSFFDMEMGEEAEKVYHAFVMGLFLWLAPDYEVKSNRESGYGRYDIMIIPQEKTKLGFIIEFKKTRKKETLEAAMKSALEQIEYQKYETELLQRGIKNYKKLAIVFKGKEVTVKEG
ncbi:MAG: AAA family ATPase [Candidatus Aminicenantes bacterium]|nr:MAG: AAA family ATPase [Candidatus Aminicenantes bacterium]